jgi:hypothetical protein
MLHSRRSDGSIERGQRCNHNAYIVGRVFERDLLASQLVTCRIDRLASRVLGLCGSAAYREFTDLFATITAKAPTTLHDQNPIPAN